MITAFFFNLLTTYISKHLNHFYDICTSSEVVCYFRASVGTWKVSSAEGWAWALDCFIHLVLGRDYVAFAFIYVHLNPGMELEKDIFACALEMKFFKS